MAGIVVIGAANLDLVGTPADELLPDVSNPGVITLSPGGAARNVAADLSQMGHKVHLITAVGDDPFGEMLLAATAQAGVDVSNAFQFPGRQTGLYLALVSEGQVMAAVSATGIIEELTPGHLQERAALFEGAEAVVADANLLPETLSEVLRLSRNALLCLLCVSPKKATRLRGVLGGAEIVVCSAREAEVLAGRPVKSRGDVLPIGRTLLSRGPKVVAITMAEQGAAIITKDAYLWAPAPDVEVLDPTGAGDAFASGVIHGRILGLPLEEMSQEAMNRVVLALRARRSLQGRPFWAHPHRLSSGGR